MRNGMVVWFSGLSGSGKPTIARLKERTLAEVGRRVEVLDGDEVRRGLNPELGFGYEGRMRPIMRTVYVQGQVEMSTGLTDRFDVPETLDLVIPTVEDFPQANADRLASAVKMWSR